MWTKKSSYENFFLRLSLSLSHTVPKKYENGTFIYKYDDFAVRITFCAGIILIYKMENYEYIKAVAAQQSHMQTYIEHKFSWKLPTEKIIQQFRVFYCACFYYENNFYFLRILSFFCSANFAFEYVFGRL
jgi:hypothetical protein